MIEVGALAASVVGSFLVPLLKDGVDQLTKELAERVGTSSADGLVGVAKNLWSKIWGKTKGTDDEAIVSLFEQQPDKLAPAVTKIVEQILADDPKFRAEIDELVESRDQGGSARWTLMGEYVGAVDARNAKIEGGQVAGIILNSPPQGRTRPTDGGSTGGA